MTTQHEHQQNYQNLTTNWKDVQTMKINGALRKFPKMPNNLKIEREREILTQLWNLREREKLSCLSWCDAMVQMQWNGPFGHDMA